MIRERAFAKVNLLLHVGPMRADGLHEICSLFASVELADELTVELAERDEVACPAVEGPNLAERAIAELRSAIGERLPPLRVTIDKRIPIAAGLGGGSADAAAVLRAGNHLAGGPLRAEDLRELAVRIGADVPSQVEPGHALVRGAGERVEPVGLPEMGLVMVPDRAGLSTAEVYREADRVGATRDHLDPDRVRRLAAEPLELLVGELENDLHAPALSLRPELADRLRAVRDAGALSAIVTGSGPTVVGIFADRSEAQRARERLPGSIETGLRQR